MKNNQTEYIAEIIKHGLSFDFRHAQYAAGEILILKGKDRKKRLTQYGIETNFLTNRSLQYGFYRFLKKEMKQDTWVKRHKTELVFFILLDLLYPEHATLKGSRAEPFDLPDNLRIFIEQRLSTRQSRRILRDEYPELFFSPPKNIRKKLDDNRLNPFTSIFSEIPIDDSPESAAAMQLLTIQQLASMNYQDLIDEQREIGAHLRMVDPDDLEDLNEFMKIANPVIQLFSMTFGPVKEGREKWIVMAEKFSDHPETYLAEGLLLKEERHYEAAISAFDRAMEAGPDAFRPYMEKSLAWLDLGNKEKAALTLKTARKKIKTLKDFKRLGTVEQLLEVTR